MPFFRWNVSLQSHGFFLIHALLEIMNVDVNCITYEALVQDVNV